MIFYGSAGKSFIVQHYFLMHKANHGNVETEELPFQCDICKKGFVKEEFLNRHKVRHRVRNAPQVSRNVYFVSSFYYSQLWFYETKSYESLFFASLSFSLSRSVELSRNFLVLVENLLFLDLNSSFNFQIENYFYAFEGNYQVW